MTQTLITRAGLARLREELEHLTTTGRQEIAERIRHAVSSERNMVENGDYHDAREEQALLERRIAILQERIVDANVVDPDSENGVLDVGEGRVQWVRRVGGWKHGKAWTQDTGESADVEERSAEPFGSDGVAVRFGDALDEAVESEPTEIVGHAALLELADVETKERRKMFAKIPVGEAHRL